MMGKSKENVRGRAENFEIMPVPKIEVKREPGTELLARFLSEQKKPLGESDEENNNEAMDWIALTYNHPEWKSEVMDKIKKHKEFIKNPEQLYERTIKNIRDYEKNNAPLDIGEEIKKREGMIPVYRNRIKKLIEYFRPNPKTSDIKNVEIIPCDSFLSSTETGRADSMGNIRFIMSHTENLDNFDHEFLHGIINPITDKLVKELSEEKINKIAGLAGDKLKKDYGDYPLSLLNEEIIRTYNNFIKNNDYRQFEKDELRERLFSFYKNYEWEKSKDESLSFEDFLLENFKKILD